MENLTDDADLPALRDHFRQCFEQSYATLLDDAPLRHLLTSLATQDVGGLVPSADETVVIGYDDTAIIGSAVWARRSGIIYLWGVYIAQPYQRQGLGTKFLRRILRQQATPADLELTVLQASAPAVAFYKGVGFRVQSETKFPLTPRHEFPVFVMTAHSADIARSLELRSA